MCPIKMHTCQSLEACQKAELGCRLLRTHQVLGPPLSWLGYCYASLPNCVTWTISVYQLLPMKSTMHLDLRRVGPLSQTLQSQVQSQCVE